MCFLRDKGFDCAVINPIITKNSTNMNVRKLHNDKFDSKKLLKSAWMPPLRLPIVPDDAIIDLRNLVRDYYYFKDLQSAIVLKLPCGTQSVLPRIPECVQQGHNADFLKALGSLPPCSGHACRPKRRACGNHPQHGALWGNVCPRQV
ncbi:MAG: IS110 family transposase [Enterocloster clostridioformis]